MTQQDEFYKGWELTLGRLLTFEAFFKHPGRSLIHAAHGQEWPGVQWPFGILAT
jgi:hypothetical protein